LDILLAVGGLAGSQVKAVLISLCAAFVLVLWAIGWSEQNPEWANYQREFLTLAPARAQSKAPADWYRAQGVEIRQISIAPLKRVDRCTTCHLAVTDPNFADTPEPFRAHSAMIASHPPERFGCTICHRGEGRAVTTLAAHGQTPGSTSRMLRGDYLEAACYACHTEASLPSSATREIAAGIQTINQLSCLRCHQLNGEGESEGPDLSAIGNRRDAIELYAHLLNPTAATPGSTMPIFALTRSQAQAITIFLLTQQGGAAINDTRYRSTKETQESITLSSSSPVSASVLFFQYDGSQLFWSAGCGVCHRIGNEGGGVGPALTHIARARDRDWLRRLLRDPADVRPGGQMPQLYLNDREIDALVEFLLTLR